MKKTRNRDAQADAFSETVGAKPVATMTGTMMTAMGRKGIEG